jgi:MFS superfamily sulfate permease-like transporter
VAVALAAAVLFGGGQALAFVPQAALAGILLAVAMRLVRTVEMVRIARCGGIEIALVALSAVLVIALPIETGMLGAIVLSLLHSVAMVARPPCVELARAPGTTVWWPPHGEAGEHVPGVLVFAPGGPLNFTSAAFVRNRLREAIAHGGVLRLVVIEASGVSEIDYTGSVILQDVIANLRSQGTEVALARLSGERAQLQAERSGLLAALGAGHVFHTVEEAVRTIPVSG